MSLKRIAEELDALGQEQEEKELDETLAACGFSADEEVAPEDDDSVIFKDDDDEINAMIASVSKEAAVKDDFVVEGISGDTQDEFTQVQNVTENGGGQEDYPSVAAAAKKLASVARHLASVKAYAEKSGETSRYAKYFDVLEKTIMKKASVLRKALADKTPFSGDLGHDGPRPEKEYGSYDKSEGEEAFTKRDLNGADWKEDAHDEVGFGVPKKEADIPKLASIRLAANKSVQLAVCLLGNKAPEDVIEAQGRDFFASMDVSAIERTLKRYAETADLYEKKEEVAAVPAETVPAETVAADITQPLTEAPQAGAEVKVEAVKEEISASAEAPAAPVEEAAPAPFSADEEKEIQAMVASVKTRKAKLAAEAARRIAEEEEKEEKCAEAPAVPVEEVPVTDEVVEAAAEVPAEMPAEEVAPVDEEIVLTGASDEADAVVEPELDGIFNDDEEAVVASVKKPARFAQKIPAPKIASVEADELSQLWADDGDSVFK